MLRPRASWIVTWAEEPKPYIPSRPPGRTAASFSARYPMMPAQSSGAASTSLKLAGIAYA